MLGWQCIGTRDFFALQRSHTHVCPVSCPFRNNLTQHKRNTLEGSLPPVLFSPHEAGPARDVQVAYLRSKPLLGHEVGPAAKRTRVSSAVSCICHNAGK